MESQHVVLSDSNTQRLFLISFRKGITTELKLLYSVLKLFIISIRDGITTKTPLV